MQFVDILLGLDRIWKFDEVVVVDGLGLEVGHLLLPLVDELDGGVDCVYLLGINHSDDFFQAFLVLIAEFVAVFFEDEVLVLQHFEQSEEGIVVGEFGLEGAHESALVEAHHRKLYALQLQLVAQVLFGLDWRPQRHLHIRQENFMLENVDDLFIPVAQVAELFDLQVLQPILTPENVDSLGTEVLGKDQRDSIERRIFQEMIDGDGIDGKVFGLKGDLQWPGIFEEFQLFIADAGVLLEDVGDHSVHSIIMRWPGHIYYIHNRMSQKHEGFILRRKAEKQVQSPQTRSRSHDQTLTNHTTLSDFGKVPGEIKRVKREENCVQKIDEEVYYNADVYLKYEKMKRPEVKYEETEHVAIQVRRSPKKPKEEEVSSREAFITKEQRTAAEDKVSLYNIHGTFELNKFHQIYQLLIGLACSMQVSEVEVLRSIRAYIRFVSRENIDNVADLKFIPNKRQVFKQSFAAEREAIIIICFAIAVNGFQQLKNYCSNLLKYALDNFLLALSLLTQESNQYVESLFEENQRGHLKGKGFEGIRTTTELMTSLIVKIAKTDPLFAGQFCKIIENYSSHSVKAELYSILTFFAFYLHATKNPDKVPFLAATPGPYILQPPTMQYTLVIDFVKIFVDSSVPLKRQIKKQHFLVRPYSQYFLGEMSKYYQIVSFSDFMPIECNKLIGKIDEKRCVKHKLFKYHIDFEAKRKEVEKIGRNLDRVILLDATESVRIDNLLLVNAWRGESSDAILAEICPLLAMVAVKRLSVLEALRKIREASAKNASLGLKYINCGLAL